MSKRERIPTVPASQVRPFPADDVLAAIADVKNAVAAKNASQGGGL